ncbi:MAG: class I lanthipeptide [Bacteroidales bacterium]
MKKKSLDKKLVLNKQTITNLDMNNVKGGALLTTDGTATCVTEECNTNDCSVACTIQKFTEDLDC